MRSACNRVLVLSALLACTIPETTAHASKLRLFAGAAWNLGSAKSQLNTLESRSTNVLNLHAFPGIALGPVVLGVMGQYHFTGQMTEPATVSNTNVGSKGYTVGPGLAFQLGPIGVRGSFDFIGKTTFDIAPASGGESSYSKPSGFTAIVSYPLGPKVTLDGLFATHSYGSQTAGTVTTDVTTDKYQETFYGLGLSLSL